jgi:hypothetical protein
MSDISDVLSVLATQCSSAVYPNGTGQASVTGKDVHVFPGWPLPANLDAAVAAGKAEISVYPSGMEMNRTRYQPAQQVQSVATATLTLKQSGNVVTVGGAMPSPFTAHNMAVLIGSQAFVYPVQATDTLTSIATGLATLLAVSYPGTTSSGPVVTLPSGVVPKVVRVGTTGVIGTEWERQAQRIQITVWAPDPTTRAQIGAAIKVALAQIAFLTMPDGYGARVLSAAGSLTDSIEKAVIYRRDLFYEVEYATTVISNAATVVAVEMQLEPQPANTVIATVN